jgi:hypothetical protein
VAGSKPLRQWREDGRWSAAYDQFWSALQSRHGESEGTRMMIELLHITDRAHIIETGTESYRFKRTVAAKKVKQ